MNGCLLPLIVEGKDVYNPTPPFTIGGRELVAARVESRENERGSKVVFFEKIGDGWKVVLDYPVFDMQDPFVTTIDGKLVFGGVQVDWKSGIYTTVFYVGEDINNLKHLTGGPKGMKDIRLVQLQDRKIGVFTRPQGEVDGLGRIGFTTIDKLAGLNAGVIEKATLIKDQFKKNQWGGVNQALLLANGKIGVLGHVAEFDTNKGKRYSAMSFVFDPVSGGSTPMKVIATRENFPDTPAKRLDLKQVVFPGGLVLNGAGIADLYVGLSDAKIGQLKIKNPFV